MKIAYVARHHNQILDDTEGHITHGFRSLGHEVLEIEEAQGEQAVTSGADLLLFNHWDDPSRGEILKKFPGRKAFWYFDKVHNFDPRRAEIIQENLAVVDYGFIGDETYVMHNPNPKLRILRQGIGDRLIDQGPGNARPEVFKGEIAFTGGVYSPQRESWVSELKKKYGDRFQVYNGVYNRDLFDLCATMKIMLAPDYPVDDAYWGNRVYLMTGSGGFLIHYECKGLKSEYEEDIVYYRDREELFEKIDYYLTHEEEREKIRGAGFKRAKDLSFTFRVRQLLTFLGSSSV